MHRLQIEGGGRETMLLKVKADDLNLQHEHTFVNKVYGKPTIKFTEKIDFKLEWPWNTKKF